MNEGERSPMDDPANLESLERESLPQALGREAEMEDSTPPGIITGPSKRERGEAVNKSIESSRLRFGENPTPEDIAKADELLAEANAIQDRVKTREASVADARPKGPYKKRPHWIPRHEWPENEK